jgi:hypothetical protein
MIIARALIAFLTAVSFITSASAATVSAEQGQVLVNQGNGYKLLAQPTVVQPGAQVMANPRGVARVEYQDGCLVRVEPGEVLTVEAQSPCKPSGSHVETGGSLKDGPQPAPRRSWDLLIIPGVVGVIGACAAWCDDRAASP